MLADVTEKPQIIHRGDLPHSPYNAAVSWFRLALCEGTVTVLCKECGKEVRFAWVRLDSGACCCDACAESLGIRFEFVDCECHYIDGRLCAPSTRRG